MPFTIGAILSAIFGVVSNPYVMKFSLFGVFLTILYFVRDILKGFITPYLDMFGSLPQNIVFIFCKTGVFEAISLYVTALISAFIINNVMGFVKG